VLAVAIGVAFVVLSGAVRRAAVGGTVEAREGAQ